MSREIKFRCWDQKDKKYLLPEKQGFVILPTMPSFGVTLPYENCSNPGNIDEDCIDWADADLLMGRYELEQYTGLKDKNGKEIYEGDIVNLEYYKKPFGKKRWSKTYPLKGGKDINIVGFEDGFFKFYREDKDGFGSELAFSDYGEWEGKDGAYKYEAEVIGNINENPELLGGEE